MFSHQRRYLRFNIDFRYSPVALMCYGSIVAKTLPLLDFPTGLPILTISRSFQKLVKTSLDNVVHKMACVMCFLPLCNVIIKGCWMANKRDSSGLRNQGRRAEESLYAGVRPATGHVTVILICSAVSQIFHGWMQFKAFFMYV